MIMPSIALPTGPYDWHPEEIPRTIFESRVTALRNAMTERGVTHAVIHGNVFDHSALAWLTHFTPKLGPAYALVPSAGPLRLLFAGGPGMKPSAQRLTWVEDVTAIETVEADVKRWLAEMAGAAVRVGLVEGISMLRGHWCAVQRAAGGQAVELDVEVDAVRSQAGAGDAARAERAARVLAKSCEALCKLAQLGSDLRAAVIEMERAAYLAGAQDVRVRIGRRPGARPTALPDGPLPMSGPTEVAMAVRYSGVWANSRTVLGEQPGAAPKAECRPFS